MEMMLLYRFSPPDEMIETQYGAITYLSWLQFEKARISNTAGREAEIVSDHKDRCGLMVNRIAGKES